MHIHALSSRVFVGVYNFVVEHQCSCTPSSGSREKQVVASQGSQSSFSLDSVAAQTSLLAHSVPSKYVGIRLSHHSVIRIARLKSVLSFRH